MPDRTQYNNALIARNKANREYREAQNIEAFETGGVTDTFFGRVPTNDAQRAQLENAKKAYADRTDTKLTPSHFGLGFSTPQGLTDIQRLEHRTFESSFRINKLGTEQEALLGGLLEQQRTQGEAFRAQIESNRLQFGQLFQQIMDRISNQGSEADAARRESEAQAMKFRKAARSAALGNTRTLDTSAARGRATRTSSLGNFTQTRGSSRATTF